MDVERLKEWEFAPILHRYDIRDTLLYALSVCSGCDPLQADHLEYLRDGNPQVLPSMCTVLGSPGFWLGQSATCVNPRDVLHGEQSLEMHSSLQPSGFVVGKTCVEEVINRGQGFGHLIRVRRELEDATSGEAIATLRSTLILRDGSKGASFESRKPRSMQPPALPPALSIAASTWAHSALLYRLNGDYNRLHSNDEFAQEAGFPRPILHGLCTFGTTCLVLIRALCENKSSRMRLLSMRFTGHVFPGERLQVDVWHEAPGTARFIVSVPVRSVVVIENGRVEF